MTDAMGDPAPWGADPSEVVAGSPGAAALLADLLRRPAWHAHAACRGQGPGPWFPERGAPPNATDDAKAICSGCPVRGECLSAAEDYGPTLQGVWAGQSQRDRQRARRGAA